MVATLGGCDGTIPEARPSAASPSASPSASSCHTIIAKSVYRVLGISMACLKRIIYELITYREGPVHLKDTTVRQNVSPCQLTVIHHFMQYEITATVIRQKMQKSFA